MGDREEWEEEIIQGHEETFGCDGYVHFLTDYMGIYVCQMDQLVPFKYVQFTEYRIFLNRTIF